MALETGLNFELLHEKKDVSKRHCKKCFYFEFLAGKESVLCDAKWLALTFSPHFLIFTTRMIMQQWPNG